MPNAPARSFHATVWVALLGGLLTPHEIAAQVTATGFNQYGQATVPAGLPEVVSVEAGREFSLALHADGIVTGWGHNGENRATPPVGLTGVVALSSASYHTLALRADGTVTGWGFNGNGILNIPAGLNNVLAVAAGGYHSLAVKRDGTVIGWGFAGNGRTTPPDSLTDVVAIAAGRDHSVALKSDGTVVAWGLNDLGQCNVPAGLTGVIAIAAGDNHTLALRSDGTVAGWGANNAGQAAIPAGLTGVVAVSAGAEHSLALKSDGTVTGWGNNASGQRNLSGSNIRALAAGGYHSLALRGAGPALNSHPRSQTVLAGATVTFSVGASSATGHQWLFNGQILPGQNEATLTLANVGRGQAGVYAVRVTGAGGVTTSQSAVLIVRGLQQLAVPAMLGNGGLRLTFGDQHGDPIAAPNAARYQVQVSADLLIWMPLNLPLQLLNGRLQIDDPDAGNHPRRFYRVVEP